MNDKRPPDPRPVRRARPFNAKKDYLDRTNRSGLVAVNVEMTFTIKRRFIKVDLLGAWDVLEWGKEQPLTGVQICTANNLKAHLITLMNNKRLLKDWFPYGFLGKVVEYPEPEDRLAGNGPVSYWWDGAKLTPLKVVAVTLSLDRPIPPPMPGLSHKCLP